ncbi:MAG: hypothetical protein FWE70_00565 [Oscillospiraceae bacterium]|nr:hypothetical protein [Oscillospiraceae bacterium]
MNDDKRIVRRLAWEYAEASQDPKNAEKMRLHRAVNDLRQVRPVVLLDEIPFHELNYDGSLNYRCGDRTLAHAEWWMRNALFKWRHFPADMFLQPFFPIQKIIRSTGIGIATRETILPTDPRNGVVSHAYHDQLPDVESIERLTEPILSYDRESTAAMFDKVADAIGDILPVRITGHKTHIVPWDDLSRHHGIERMLLDTADRPDYLHAAIRKLIGFEVSKAKQMEDLGLFEIQMPDIHCTPALASDLPGDYDGGVVRRGNIWGKTHSQIFGSVSREAHEEFCLSYLREVMEPFRLVYYGCCEPLDRKVDMIGTIPHLRKISITPWADIEMSAEAIGGKYVLSSKPNPALVAVDLDEGEVRREIGGILSACKRHGCNCDIVLKDISTVGYRADNLMRWERIAMELVEGW